MTRKNQIWIVVCALFAFALISLCAFAYIHHGLVAIPKGMQAAPNPTPSGIIQLILSALATGGFSLTGIIVAIVNLFAHGATSPADPNTPKPKGVSDALADLIVAFPAYITDMKSSAKSRRFWFDLIQVGIEQDPDEETRVWLQQGSEILRKRFFTIPEKPAV